MLSEPSMAPSVVMYEVVNWITKTTTVPENKSQFINLFVIEVIINN